MTSSPTVIPVPGAGAEDVCVATHGADAGAVFTGVEDGRIFRVSPDGQQVDLVAETGGRPLGIEHDAEGHLVVCDATRGLLRVDPADGSVEVLATEVGGVRIRVCNNAAVAADGTIWFSDSSTQHDLEHWKRDFVENTRTGRLLRRDPDGSVHVVLDGLAFANGVALSREEDFVCVAETGARAVVRRWLTGDRAGMRDLLAQNLPGYPDNIALGSDDLVWVTIGSPTEPLVERLHRGPLKLRKLVGRAPERLQPQVKRTVRVLAYDRHGELVHDLDLPAEEFHGVTGVREHGGRVWLASLFEAAVAVHDLRGP